MFFFGLSFYQAHDALFRENSKKVCVIFYWVTHDILLNVKFLVNSYEKACSTINYFMCQNLSTPNI